jgi:YebC/PmpR family DNA-binding regulatory protein|tara:strand:- start:279 stop:1007 length:729 start_codon:yes stop_codon:yes gene_type:complete
MAGHSKWSTIKRKKGALDQKRGKLFSNISKEITVSSRLGGKDIDSNPRLRQAVKKAKALNMPNSNIDKAIKKGVGELDNVIIEEVSYEGYGPFGVAIIIEAITDNKNRTVADIRHALSKFGGSLGQAGSVSWNFERNGIILIDKNEISEGDIFEFSIENDCIEFFEDDDCYRLHFHSNELYNKLDLLEKLSIKVDSSFLAYVPKDEIGLNEDDNQKVEKLLEFLDDLEDVQNVFSNQTLGQS